MIKIIIDNPIICSFYENNPNISCEKVNLLLIDMLTRLGDDNVITSNHYNNSNSREVADIRTEISDILTDAFNKIDTQHTNQSQEQIKDIVANFDLKSTMMLHNIQQPIYSFISNSEERINKNITAINERQPTKADEYSMLLKDISNIIHNNQSNVCVNSLRTTCNTLYTSADVRSIELTNVDQAVTMKRFRCSDVLIQRINSEDNIHSEQIDGLYKNVSDYNYSGIIISESSGFSGKKDFHLDIHNNHVIVFIHKYQSNELKLEMAVNMIDNIMKHINLLKLPTDTGISISKEVLDKINNEYQLFISQKNAVVEILKDTQKKVIAQMDEIKFPFLEKYLSTKYVAPVCNSGLKCDVCKNYSANNLKALAAHKRGCLRKHPHYSKQSNAVYDKENMNNNIAT